MSAGAVAMFWGLLLILLWTWVSLTSLFGFLLGPVMKLGRPYVIGGSAVVWVALALYAWAAWPFFQGR